MSKQKLDNATFCCIFFSHLVFGLFWEGTLWLAVPTDSKTNYQIQQAVVIQKTTIQSKRTKGTGMSTYLDVWDTDVATEVSMVINDSQSTHPLQKGNNNNSNTTSMVSRSHRFRNCKEFSETQFTFSIMSLKALKAVSFSSIVMTGLKPRLSLSSCCAHFGILSAAEARNWTTRDCCKKSTVNNKNEQKN